MNIKNRGIVCTLGPASWNHIKELKAHGMSIARINGSFGIPYKGAIKELKDNNIPIIVDIPGTRIKEKVDYITDEDLINFSIENKVDYVGISYVRNAQEVIEMKNRLNPHGIKIIAKIETKESLENREEIIKVADAILIDRGDLGTAIGFEKVPKSQILVLADCNKYNKPVIVATEMMMSTINSTKPSCADVSDVYFALHHGANYVMLSEETALGKEHISTVKIMSKIIKEFE